MSNDYRVNVYEGNYEGGCSDSGIIARVRANTNLDYWDGHNMTNGGVGEHKGITKLRDGRYVIIFTTQWQGKRDVAYVVSEKKALDEILYSGHTELLDTFKFRDLKKFATDSLIDELDDDDDEV